MQLLILLFLAMVVLGLALLVSQAYHANHTSKPSSLKPTQKDNYHPPKSPKNQVRI